MEFVRKDSYGIGDLLEIVRILRAPGGCPWDREQTHASIRQNLIEETYEVADAIDQEDTRLLCEELGDLLLQVALHVQMEAEAGGFTFGDVCDGICKKLIYRHPHVFGELSGALSTNQVLHNWEALKNTEKGRETAADRLDSVPQSLPAPMYAEKVQKRAAAFGFTYTGAVEALKDLESEIAELRQAIEAEAQAVQSGGEAPDGKAGKSHAAAAEAGDVLFSAVNVARLVGADAELALSQSSTKFANRVKRVEVLAAEEGKTLEDLDAARRDVLWKRAKGMEEKQ